MIKKTEWWEQVTCKLLLYHINVKVIAWWSLFRQLLSQSPNSVPQLWSTFVTISKPAMRNTMQPLLEWMYTRSDHKKTASYDQKCEKKGYYLKQINYSYIFEISYFPFLSSSGTGNKKFDRKLGSHTMWLFLQITHHPLDFNM